MSILVHRGAADYSSYMKLIKGFPLEPITNDDHLDRAQSVIEGLLARTLDQSEEKYLDVLSDLVAAYEEKRFPIEASSPKEVLLCLMEANQLSQSDVAQKTGIAKSTLSSIIADKRSMAMDHVLKLSRLFNVGPQVFITQA